MRVPGTFAPRPGAAPLPRMVAAQAALEVKLLLRNGEQVLLTLVIPVLVLVGLSRTTVVDVGPGERVAVGLPGVLALAVISAAFTGQAIATGFERRYGVLKRLGSTPLPRAGLLAGKTVAVCCLEVVQAGLLLAVAVLLGWSATGSWAGTLLLVAVGTLAFSALALLMAGTLRAEATLAGANLVYLVLVALGGVVVPLDRYPEAVRGPLALLPLGALSEGLRAALPVTGEVHWDVIATSALVLLGWGGAAAALAARTFRWD